MSRDYVLSFVKGFTVDRPSADRAIVQMPITSSKCTFEGLSPALGQVIDVLSSVGASEDELACPVEEIEGASALARFYYYLFTFAERRVLSYGVSCGGRPLATLVPASTSFSFSPGRICPLSKYILSRFAYLHREEELVLESPLSHGKITLHGSAAGAITAELANAHTLDSLCDLLQDVPRGVVALFLELLVGAGFVSELEDDALYPAKARFWPNGIFTIFSFMREAAMEGITTHTEEPTVSATRSSHCRQ